MQENLQSPRQGRALLMAHEAKVLERVKMYTHPDPIFLVDGDRVAINWIFDATSKDGITRRLNEIALQRWVGDRIAEERFVYDSASAWGVVESAYGIVHTCRMIRSCPAPHKTRKSTKLRATSA